MFSKQEASKLRHEFWTVFGKYMSPVLSAEGVKINWVNYKTGEKHIHFKLDAGNKSATIAIELTHKDEGIRHLYFEQFLQLRAIFEDVAGDDWEWQQNNVSETGVSVSRIYSTISGKSIFNKHDWPELISFFKQRIIGLDEFWSSVKYSFEALR